MSGSRVFKGEPTATDSARLRRSLTDAQKAELRASLRRLLGRHAAVLNPPSEEPRA
jgi:hypothetical protein